MEKFKVGIVGCGFISNYHIQGLQSVEDVEVEAVCDFNIDVAKKQAERYRISRYMSDTEELFALKNIDAVLILTPNFTHKDLAIAAVRNGKHVMVQKPFAPNLSDCQDMIRIAEEEGVQLVPSFMHRFFPECRKAKEIIKEGLIGRLMTVRIRNGVQGATWAKWFFDPEKTGGGAVIDVGVHGIDLLRYLIGEILEVGAFTEIHERYRKMDDGTNVELKYEDSATVIYRFDNNVLGLHDISWSQKAGAKRFELEIYGDKGTITIRKDEHLLKVASSEFDSVNNWVIPEIASEPMGYKQHKDFVDGIKGISKPSLTARDGLATIKVIKAIYKSAEENIFVSIE
ncbi:MAG: Gfo/Idh/MocA family oxidoreductase [Firmicutes bacterium]|nr:Gfo/Idh/MocA family oxidoreductase [Bacillota bacterium]